MGFKIITLIQIITIGTNRIGIIIEIIIITGNKIKVPIEITGITEMILVITTRETKTGRVGGPQQDQVKTKVQLHNSIEFWEKKMVTSVM